MRHRFSLSLLCCAQLLAAGCADLNSPTISYPGISTTAITSNTISVAWSKATDGLTPPEALVYKVYLSGANPAYQSFDTIPEIEAGTLVATLTNANSTTINTGLAAGNSYYINVVVQDEEGNKAVYEPLGEYFHGGLVFYYPFSGNTNDVTAALNHLVLATGTSTPATLALPTLTLDRFGHVSSAYNFAPTSTTAQCLQSTNLMSLAGLTGNASRTVSLWVQSANTTTAQRAPFAWGDGSIAGSNFGAYETGNASNWAVWLYGAADLFTTAAVTSTWDHLVIGYDSATSTVYLYKNGVPVTSAVVAASTADTLLYVGCGMDLGVLSHPYQGKIDDLRVFNGPLTNVEIAALYNATRP